MTIIQKTKENIRNNIWKTVTIMITVFSLIGGVWAFENRYALKREIEPIIIAQNDIQTSQKKFHQQQENLTTRQSLLIKQQQMQIINTKREFYQMILDDINSNLQDARTYLRQHPADEWIKDRIRELESSKNKLEDRIEALVDEASSLHLVE